jgi:hypothetical protein
MIAPRRSDGSVASDDAALLEEAIRQLAQALERACRHEDPENSGLCIRCGVVLEYDGPLSLVDSDLKWSTWKAGQ